MEAQREVRAHFHSNICVFLDVCYQITLLQNRLHLFENFIMLEFHRFRLNGQHTLRFEPFKQYSNSISLNSGCFHAPMPEFHGRMGVQISDRPVQTNILLFR